MGDTAYKTNQLTIEMCVCVSLSVSRCGPSLLRHGLAVDLRDGRARGVRPEFREHGGLRAAETAGGAERPWNTFFFLGGGCIPKSGNLKLGGLNDFKQNLGCHTVVPKFSYKKFQPQVSVYPSLELPLFCPL